MVIVVLGWEDLLNILIEFKKIKIHNLPRKIYKFWISLLCDLFNFLLYLLLLFICIVIIAFLGRFIIFHLEKILDFVGILGNSLRIIFSYFTRVVSFVVYISSLFSFLIFSLFILVFLVFLVLSFLSMIFTMINKRKKYYSEINKYRKLQSYGLPLTVTSQKVYSNFLSYKATSVRQKYLENLRLHRIPLREEIEEIKDPPRELLKDKLVAEELAKLREQWYGLSN